MTDRNIPTDQQLMQLGNEAFNVPAILRMLDAEAKGAYGGSERTQIELVARLCRAQQAEIERLRTIVRSVNRIISQNENYRWKVERIVAALGETS